MINQARLNCLEICLLLLTVPAYSFSGELKLVVSGKRAE